MNKGIVFLSALLLSAMGINVCSRELLTFEERVKAQEAIERVYYNHRIWPKENPQPKPSFEKMVPKEVIEAKVTDYLKKCSALDQFWQRPIVASQLQAEMDRMAKGSKDPATLNELFTALNNDPYLIAECLARPVLADRLIHNWYANDERLHKEAKEKAEEALKPLTPENFCSYPEGQYSKMTYRLETENREEMNEPDPDDNSIKIDENELASMLTELPEEGKISEIQENNDSFMIVHTIAKNGGGIEVESLSFQKTGVDKWLKKQDLQTAFPDTESDSSMYLPPTPEGTCEEGWWDNGILDDSIDVESRHTAIWTGTEMIIWWRGERYNPSTDTWIIPSSCTECAPGKIYHTAVWTGSEMIVWGGSTGSTPYYVNTGGRYNPLTDSWTATSTGSNCPSNRYMHTAVWTGTEMIIWGGFGQYPEYKPDGGRYNPSSDSWTAISTGTNCPSARANHTAVWTDSEMIIWGGYNGSSYFQTGSRYNPSTDTWTAVSTGTSCPEARYYHTAVWTGTQMIVWGGVGASTYKTGARYNPSSDTWTSTSTGANCPLVRYLHTAVWTGSKMIIWGGHYGSSLQTGGCYDPATDMWTATSTGTNCPSAREMHTAVWTDTEMIVWGGSGGSNTGARYNPMTDTWVPTYIVPNVPSTRINHTSVWTGAEMIIWGGSYSDYLNTGGRYNPSLDSWAATSTGTNCPSGRSRHTAVWTGMGMMVWGGYNGSYMNSGGSYNPSADSWTATSTGTNCPSARHTKVIWTGSEMIIWGGYNGGNLNTGGKYNPATETWTATSTGTNCPSGRSSHAAVWTGSEMIIWGGYDGSNSLNTGGKYNPSTDNWTATSTETDCPSVRSSHTAVWTGSEMIIWGGYISAGNESSWFNTGGRYNPSIDTWTATSIGTYCPTARNNHTAVWTGTEMIVWGGCYYDPGFFSLSTGGKYDPSTDLWTPTSTGTNCPSARYDHTAVWTGTSMILWGGYTILGYTLQSGIYFIPYSPSGLSNNNAVDADSCNSNGILVGWSAPSKWGDGSGGTRTYDVLKDSAPIATGLSESTLFYTDTTCVTGTSYLYQVRANNGCGLSTTTAGISAADNIGASPSGFVNNTAADQNVCCDNGVLVSWTAPSSWGDGSSGTRTFDILREGTPIATGLSESTLSYTDTTGDNGVSYLYQVRANNSCGLSTTTTGVSAADNIGTPPDEVLNFDNVYSWDAVSGADGYRLYRGIKADLPGLKTSAADGCIRYDGTATSFDCSGDDPSEATGGLYWYLVTAYTGVCEGTSGEGTGFTRGLSSSGVCP